MLAAETKPGVSPTRFRLTVDDYLRLGELGAFKGHRVELVEGEIFKMSPMGTPHRWALAELNRVLSAQVSLPHLVLVQVPVRMSPWSEPEPDLAVVKRPASRDAVFSAADVSLLIEVADSSLDYDLGDKMRLYARSNVPEYWVVDVEHQALIVHHGPTDTGYQHVIRHGRSERVTSQTAPRITLAVQDALR